MNRDEEEYSEPLMCPSCLCRPCHCDERDAQMTGSARVKELEKALKASINLMAEIGADRDAQAALVERMRESLKNASPRCESKIGNCEGECPTCVEYNETLDMPASTALQEFKERCWADAIDSTWRHVNLLANGGATLDRASIVAELRKSTASQPKGEK